MASRTWRLPLAPGRTPFYYGWVILAVATVANFASAPGQTYTFSVFLEHFRDDLGLPSTLISTLYLIGTVTASVMIVGIGRILDLLGGRVMLVLSGVLIGVGALWMSQVSGAVELLIGFAMMRTLGQGSLSLIPTTLVSIWFVRNRARALAIVGLGGAVAGGAFPIMSSWLITVFDWRGAWVAIAIIVWGVLLLPAGFLVRRSPESVGLTPDGADSRAQRASDGRSPTEEFAFTVREAVRTRSLWLLMFAATAQSMVATGLMFHQISLFGARGLSSATAAGVFGVIAPAMIAGQFLSGFLAERYPLRYMVAAAQLFLTATVLFIFLVSDPWHVFLYGAILGVTTGFLMNSLMAIWPQYYGREHLGSIRGVTQFASMAASAAGPLPLAVAFDVTDSYTSGLVVFAVIPLVCGVAALLAVRPTAPVRSGLR
ncbi:MAG: MFS transporter [SAR202 cluster bacterium]|jgi:MFS family permease|nr:hypothetical protein [Chloroflexota bacterium]MDP6420273.1 MFS transporter [SAR202 cluster bacterium]HAL47795.1 hypothetical protein [Dehalococcoidia bacterium]MDP6664988.1 MFS transporter [SAR202 cluster bacterium]MDP6798633.1 MFS transporter [SAR202 cluster bacterium]|tara:strand:- start:3905 stop:5191 length:1287 start_codon:yes stop_codon:yes gene_type:complete